jgi:hypothetical protein
MGPGATGRDDSPPWVRCFMGIATGRGLTVEDVRTRVKGTWRPEDVEQYLAGTAWPDWPFVEEFAKVVAGSKWHQAGIKEQVRPAWRAAAPMTPRESTRTAHRLGLVVVTAVVLAVAGVILAQVLPSRPGRATSSQPVCSSPPPGLGAQRIYCDDFRTDKNEWEDPNSPHSGDGVYRLGSYLLTAPAGGEVQVGAPQQAQLGLYTSVNVLISVLASGTSVPGVQYGLVCRAGPDAQLHLGGKGYAFVINDGAAIIEKVEYQGGNPVVDPLATIQHAVPVRDGANLLQASCQTQTPGPVVSGHQVGTAVLLRFWVNGKQVASYEDIAGPFTSGYVGVTCITAKSTPQQGSATFEQFGVFSVAAAKAAPTSSALPVHPSKTAASPTRSLPAPTPGTQSPTSVTVMTTVNPTQWQPQPVPGLIIAIGDLVSITATSGQWSCASQTGYTSIEGSPNYNHVATNRDWAVPSAPFCSLIGKIGSGPWQGLAPSFQIVAGYSGQLELTANDLMPDNCPQPPTRTSCYSDNRGTITVRVTVSPSS